MKSKRVIPAQVQPVVMPDSLVLVQDFLFIGKTKGRPFKTILKTGEIGNYFRLLHCFTFKHRHGWTPYIFCSYLKEHPELWSSIA